MKRTTSFVLSVFAIAMTFSVGAGAAQDTPPVDAKGENTETTAPGSPAQVKPRHSHVAEKLGVPARQAAPSGERSVHEDKTPDKRHDHQRDMK
ncbi:hypothetical protein [Aromatoleum anaerobium]|uniref:Uncharacterized protein n=1 Tax=Aromatoleum anaerobium TaxID=182180 RepID=A0ABX1PSA8_9RHOO|nr:hypothetical protein [Aromatoleum anaerobium]MCK0506477.1 hypothetical protein [Aromatoleum anaerobium]